MLRNVRPASAFRDVLKTTRALGRRHASEETKAKPRATSKRESDIDEADRGLSIPGPTWLWTTIQPLTAPFRLYGRAAKNRPYVTQVASSLVIYFLGDLSSQYIRHRFEHPDAPGEALRERYDAQRGLRAVCIGAIASLPSYHWFIYLSTHFNVPSAWPLSRVMSLAYKIAVNQAVFTPIFNSYFFGMQCLLSGEGQPAGLPADASLEDRLAISDRTEAVWTRVKETVPTSWYNSFKVRQRTDYIQRSYLTDAAHVSSGLFLLPFLSPLCRFGSAV